MKILIIILILAALFAGCKSETQTGGTVEQIGNLSISGVVQNGPFRQYTQGTIQGLDSSFNQVVGESITAETTDTQGSYSSQVAFNSSVYAKVTFKGQYFNENTGAYTNGELTTSSFVFGANDSNVNLVTHIIQDRVKFLTMSNVPIADAMIQATVEFMAEATGEIVATGANSWLISDSSPLLFISVLLQHGVEGLSLQNLINSIRSDFADGTLSQANKDIFTNNAKLIQGSSVYEANVLSGLGIVTQSFTARLNTLDPSRLIVSKHVQGLGAQTSYGTLGATTKFYVPFTLNAQTQLKYLSLPCEALNITIHDSTGNVTGIYDATLNPVLSANIGNALGVAAYTKDALPLRDYGNGVIKTDQATFATALDLASGQYWLSLDLVAGCIVQTFEALPHSFLIQDAPPNKFTYPVTTSGLNSIYFEIL